MDVPKAAGHESWKITGVVAPVLLLSLLLMGWFFSEDPREKYLTEAILIAAAAIGWVLGMVLSPDSKVEAKNFSSVGKSVSLFLSGYLVSKIDGIITAIFEPQILFHASDHLAAYRLVGALAAFILTTILTYVIRIYALAVGE